MSPGALLVPPRVRPGDTVALVAPSGSVDPPRVRGASELLERRGFRVWIRPDVHATERYMAGPDARRAEELLQALADPDVRLVWCLRGGYGSQRILRRLPSVPPAPPKAVVGFSDNTALLWFLRDRWGWTVVHGPHPDPDDPGAADRVLRFLAGPDAGRGTAAAGLRLWNPGPWREVEGPVAGGCLAIVAGLCGTPWALRLAGYLVFLEDVAEPPYRIDRMLWQLRAAGSLEGCLGIVFGRLESFVPGRADVADLELVIQDFARSVRFPVLSGLPAGHCLPNMPIAFGPRYRLDPVGGHLVALQGAVR